MNLETHDELENQLAQATAWTGPQPEPELWERALEVNARQKGGPFVFGRRILNWSMPKTLAAAIVVVIGGSVVAAVLTQLEKPQRITGLAMTQQRAAPVFHNAPALDLSAALAQGNPAFGDRSAYKDGVWQVGRAGGVDGRSDGYPESWNVGMMTNGSGSRSGLVDGDGDGYAPSANLYSLTQANGLFAQGSNSTEQPHDRSVIRKATIELITANVRIAFAKALLVVSEAGSEYIQDSGVTGTDKDAQATLTLRVRAERLSEVLNQLRELGEVQSERLTGEDVTAQIIDLESRLRNERRVESELLELLEKRTDAPLKEILELRTTIASVRQTIEMMVAQRDRLGRLVSLATVLVIIRPEPVPAEEPKKVEEKTIGAYFGDSVANSWHDGLRYLADAMAGTLRIIIGGLIWWAAAIVLLLALRTQLQRRAMQ